MKKHHRSARRGPNERFLQVPFGVLRDLPEHQQVILVDMAKRHNGKNNGRIGYGCRDAAKAARISPNRGGKILDDLRARRIIRLTRDAAFNMKSGRTAREWEIHYLTKKGPFEGTRKLTLDYWLLDSPAYLGASVAEKVVLFELMRRFDGGNNGHIEFGGPDGKFIAFSRDKTERALNGLAHAGFIVETAPADACVGRRRTWRITIYSANGEKPTKDFMRPSKPVGQNAFDGIGSAVVTPLCVSSVRSEQRFAASLSSGGNAKTGSQTNPLTPIPPNRSTDTQSLSINRIRDTHVETIPFDDAGHMDWLPLGEPRSCHAPTPEHPSPLPRQGDEFGSIATSSVLSVPRAYASATDQARRQK
jgi:hypothetical protein